MEKFMFETKETEALKCIYDHMQDDESRQIYLARSCFSLSDDRKYMQCIIKNMVVSKVLYEGIAMHNKQKKVRLKRTFFIDLRCLFRQLCCA